jgi:hypothetical protein
MHLKYRPDIDGLRALAVLGVVIYHAFPRALPGGFIGVDIFFVISGYLISGILYKGQREGNFSYKQFYARRIKRLFPALVTMLLLCLVYGWLVLLPDELKQLGKHVASGSVFIQNFVFWKESGYFDKAAELKPLLHLWSLGVEEQFYIFFPLLLILLWKKPRVLIPAMILLLVGSFILNVVMSYQHSASDFFLTPYRGWEFLGGSLLAWWHYDRGHEEETTRWRELFSWAGGAIMVLGMALLTKDQSYPGWRALLPVTGTLLVLEGGRSAWVNLKILSHPAMVWVGLLSYPIYLFHWPVLSFARIVRGEASSKTIWSVLAVAFVLSVLTYYLIEKPIRLAKSSKVVCILIAAFFATGVLGCLVWMRFIKDSQSSEVKRNLRWVADDDYFEGLKSVMDYGSIPVTIIGQGVPRTLFLGDSHMQQYIQRLKELVEKNPRFHAAAVIFVTKEGVPAIPGITRADWPACSSLIPVFRHVLKDYPQIANIVIASQWNRYLFQESQTKYLIEGMPVGSKQGTEAAINNLSQMIEGLVRDGYHITLMQGPPTGYSLSPKGRMKRSFLGAHLEPVRTFSVESYLNHYGNVVDAIAVIARKNGATLFDPLPYLSTNGICLYSDGDAPIRFDECHLRAGYVRDRAVFLDSLITP